MMGISNLKTQDNKQTNMAGFKEELLKAHCTQALSRMALVKNKKIGFVQSQRKEATKDLSEHKITLARIKQEQILREEYVVEAFEIIRGYLELIRARVHIIASEKKCPAMLSEAIDTILWCSTTSEIKEFQSIKADLQLKYGKKYIKEALDDQNKSIDPYVLSKLTTNLPDPKLVNHCLKALAQEAGLDIPALRIDPDDDFTAPIEPPYEAQQDGAVNPAPITGFAPTQAPGVDDLAARFSALDQFGDE